MCLKEGRRRLLSKQLQSDCRQTRDADSLSLPAARPKWSTLLVYSKQFLRTCSNSLGVIGGLSFENLPSHKFLSFPPKPCHMWGLCFTQCGEAELYSMTLYNFSVARKLLEPMILVALPQVPLGAGLDPFSFSLCSFLAILSGFSWRSPPP